MSKDRLHCQTTRDALLRVFEESVRCSREDDALVLDTPYTFGDGHFLRVYLFETEQGIVVSDGGYAAQELEMLSPTPTTKSSYRSLQRLVTESGFHWDGQISFAAPTLDDALYRLHQMALLMHEAEILLAQRGKRPRAHMREYLSKGLRVKFGIRTEDNYDILLPKMEEPVKVDMLAFGEKQQAAIELLEARSLPGIERSMNQSLVKFFNLARGEYDGLLIGVYNDEVLNRDRRFLTRYNNLKPAEVQLMSREEALDKVGLQLQAA